MSSARPQDSEISAPKTIISVVLMLDISGSMDAILDSAKSRLAQLPAAIAKSNPSARLQVAVVAFSDYTDDPIYRDKESKNDTALWRDDDTLACQVCDFTEAKYALKFLHRLKIQSGGDLPEALELAFHRTSKLSWPVASNGCRIVRQVFVVTDSLPHGAGYDVLNDNFPKKGRNPAQLDWQTEMTALTNQGVEFHVITCPRLESKAVSEFYKTLAGKTGSITHLKDTRKLIESISEKVKEGDDLDDLINGLNGMCVENRITADDAMDKLTDAISSIQVKDADAEDKEEKIPAKEVAVAKLDGWNRRHFGFYDKSATDKKADVVTEMKCESPRKKIG